MKWIKKSVNPDKRNLDYTIYYKTTRYALKLLKKNRFCGKRAYWWLALNVLHWSGPDWDYKSRLQQNGDYYQQIASLWETKIRLLSTDISFRAALLWCILRQTFAQKFERLCKYSVTENDETSSNRHHPAFHEHSIHCSPYNNNFKDTCDVTFDCTRTQSLNIWLWNSTCQASQSLRSRHNTDQKHLKALVETNVQSGFDWSG